MTKASLGNTLNYKDHKEGFSKISSLDYHIPIIQNVEGLSPLHVAKKASDYKSIDVLLKYLSVYDIDHHSKAIKDLIPNFIEKNLSSIPEYLTSRMQFNE